MGSSVSLGKLEAEGSVIKSYPVLWTLVLPVLLIIWSGYLYTYAGVTGTGLEYVSSIESSSTYDWEDYSDDELGVSFSYPADFEVVKLASTEAGKSSIINVNYRGDTLLSMQEQGYTGSIANVIKQKIADLDAQYVANNVKWGTKVEETRASIHYIYPISGDEGTRVDPIFVEIDDYGKNRMLVVSLSYEALDPSVEDDVYKVGNSLVTAATN
jgi:hypothetical protein